VRSSRKYVVDTSVVARAVRSVIKRLSGLGEEELSCAGGRVGK
jgi:hypothetical protein